MRFLVDANLARPTMALLDRLGHNRECALDVGFGQAPDAGIANHARNMGAAIIARDVDFADTRRDPPDESNGIIILRKPDDSAAQTIVNLLERFLMQTGPAAQIPGHLVIIESDRVRFRPALE